MLDRSSKRPILPFMPKKDFNQLALSIVQQATGEKPEKNQAAVTLGRLGGLKGGKARAEKLTSERRSEIAKKGAVTRWEKVKIGSK